MDSSQTVFDNAQSKKRYLKQVDVHFKTSMFKEKRSSIHHIDTDEQIIEIQCGSFKGYNYIQKDGRNIVTKAKDNIELEVLPFAGIYDVLMKLHVENDHEISEAVKNATDFKYLIPSICYDMIPKACNVCKGKTATTGASKYGIVSFIHNMNPESKYYNTILVYLDEYTEYIVLRPTKYGSAIDITTELFKIFMQFGPPERVCITLKEIAYIQDIKDLMLTVCSSCDVTFQFNEDDQSVLLNVMQAIGAWMKETKSVSWEIGCYKVQHQLNTRLKNLRQIGTVPVTAHNLFFNHSSVFDADCSASSDPDGDDEPLIYIKEKNVVDNEDPLYVAVGKLNIQSKGTRKSKRLQKNNGVTEVIDVSDSKGAKRKTKSKKNKIKNIEKPTEEEIIDIEDPVIETNKAHDTKSRDKSEDISSKEPIEEISDDDDVDIDFGADI